VFNVYIISKSFFHILGELCALCYDLYSYPRFMLGYSYLMHFARF